MDGRSLRGSPRPSAFSTEDLAQLDSFCPQATIIDLRGIGIKAPRGWGFGGRGTNLACMHQLHTANPQVIQAPMGLLATSRALGRVQDTLGELKDAVADLERAKRKLELEFTELYDKVSHQMSRMAKRYASRERVDEIPPEEIVIGEQPLGTDPISAKILARRNGGNIE